MEEGVGGRKKRRREGGLCPPPDWSEREGESETLRPLYIYSKINRVLVGCGLGLIFGGGRLRHVRLRK